MVLQSIHQHCTQSASQPTHHSHHSSGRSLCFNLDVSCFLKDISSSLSPPLSPSCTITVINMSRSCPNNHVLKHHDDRCKIKTSSAQNRKTILNQDIDTGIIYKISQKYCLSNEATFPLHYNCFLLQSLPCLTKNSASKCIEILLSAKNHGVGEL